MNRWPSLLRSPTCRGKIRSRSEDFQVDEIPAYLPSGQGSHLFLHVEKLDLTTEQVVAGLAAQLGLPGCEFGTAGLKDRWALTRQWISLPAAAAAGLARFQMQGVHILEQKAHGNKLKTGHLRGNRFRLRIRDLPTEARGDLDERVERLRTSGAPNYFGPQRFGNRGDNEQTGRSILAGQGPKLQKRRLRLVLNAVQSALFNDVLAARIHAKTFDRALAGDLMVKADSGGQFVCTEPELDQARMDSMQIHPTGPMFGPRMKRPALEVDAQERAILDVAGLNDDSWRRFAKLTQGTRRALRLDLSSLQMEWTPEGDLWLIFELPAGAYATSVLQELILAESPNPEFERN